MDVLRKQKLLPVYSFVPLAVTLVLHFLVYIGTQLIVDPASRITVSLPADELIPLIPEWVLIYVATFFFWAAGLIIIMRADKDACFEQFGVVLASEIISLAFFLLMPTVMQRPVPEPTTYAGRFLLIVYQVDDPVNLFPSMHCLLAWLTFRAAWRSPEIAKPYKLFFLVFALLICVSTLTVKQHLLPDVISGLAFAELSIIIGRKAKLKKVYYALDRALKITKEEQT